MRPHSVTLGPRCIYCHKAIPRRVNYVEVRSSVAPFACHAGTPIADLRTIEDCRKYSRTEHVYALRLWHGYVYRFSTWDGKTWRDPYFCKDNCAKAFGYTAAKAGWKVTS